MIKTIFAVAMAITPAGAAEFALERTGLEQLRVLPAIEAPAAAPAAAEKPCKLPGPGATIEEIIAWIRCVPLPPPPGQKAAACAAGARLSVSEIENRWIAAIYVVGRNLDSIAASAQGVSPHAAPAGYAVSLSILADRTAAAAETMHYAWLDKRWHIVANEANKLDRVAADLREWAADAKAHHNASALRAGDLARAAADLSSALQWLRADSGLKAAAN